MPKHNASGMGREVREPPAADLGIEFRPNITDAKLAERIKAHLGEPTPAPKEGGSLAKGTGGKKYRITIATDSQDKQPVRVGVNGYNYTIRRGETVTVPASVVEALSNAVQYVYDPNNMQRQEVLSYPFQVHGEA